MMWTRNSIENVQSKLGEHLSKRRRRGERRFPARMAMFHIYCTALRLGAQDAIKTKGKTKEYIFYIERCFTIKHLVYKIYISKYIFLKYITLGPNSEFSVRFLQSGLNTEWNKLNVMASLQMLYPPTHRGQAKIFNVPLNNKLKIDIPHR